MNLDTWNLYFKLSPEGSRCMSQQTYEPLISKDGQTFCMNYAWDNQYQRLESDRPLYTPEVTDFFFNNEIYYIEKFKNYRWAPEIIDIDYNKKRIFFKWYQEGCNDIIYSKRNLSDYCIDWQDQIKNAMLDAYNAGVYKLTMYPHCHFIDNDGNMRALDFYGCVPVNNPFIDSKFMDGIIHETAKFRLAETGGIDKDGRYNLEIMFKRSMGEHVVWGDYSMDYIYKEIFNEQPELT
jgi:hypothetical protein